jgi:hypothetical protein
VRTKQDKALGFADLFAPKSWFWLMVRDISLNLTSVPYLDKQLLVSSLKSEFDQPYYSED